VRHVLATVVLAIAPVAFSVQGAIGATPRTACVAPRLYTLTLAAAETRLAVAGCRLAGVSRETADAHTRLVTDQVPAPGAVLPRRAGVFLVVS
jgi:hypothetical protein